MLIRVALIQALNSRWYPNTFRIDDLDNLIINDTIIINDYFYKDMLDYTNNGNWLFRLNRDIISHISIIGGESAWQAD